MFLTLIGIYFLHIIIKISLSLLDMSFVKKHSNMPAVVLSESDYKNAALIKIQNHKFEIVGMIYNSLIFCMWAFWGLKFLHEIVFVSQNMLQSVIFIMSFLLVNTLLSLPLEIYEKFIKDKKQGFSNISPKTFIIDTLKTLVLTLIFGSLVVWLVLLCFELLGEIWWFWAFVLSFAIILLINLIYPTIIAPLFNKVRPLDSGELKSAIESLLVSCGFKSSGVFVMDASKRDSRLNAYFGGLGATKRVVLFDTLIEKLSLSEIIAVLGHELGHFKHKDIVKMIAISAFMMFAMFALFGNIPTGAYEAIGLSKNGASVIVFMLLFAEIFGFMFSPLISFLSRKNEFGADEFGADVGGADMMINALKKLGSENKAFPKSHPLYSAVYHSHPSLYDRINELENAHS